MLIGMSISLMFHQSQISYRSYRMLAREKRNSCCVSFRKSNGTYNFVKKFKKRGGDKLPLEIEGSAKSVSARGFYEISKADGCQGQARVSVAVNNNGCQDVSSHTGMFPWMPAAEWLHSWQVCWCCNILMRCQFGFPNISRFRAGESVCWSQEKSHQAEVFSCQPK